ncbi:MAG TPA: hypothetical protein VHA37_00565, partial [Candidatus Saccharimonadales bacterium]|nr:hypothetical protein [Candidatus Saccharimonadales bacterium]
MASLTMILLAALLCNYHRGKCLIEIGTEGYWWHSPIQDGESLDKVCENQQAAKLLTQGLQRVLLLRDHRLVGSI